MDSRDMETIERRVADAELELTSKRAALENPSVARDPERFKSAYRDIETAQRAVDQLYARWSELEQKIT